MRGVFACDVRRALSFLAFFENAGCGSKCTSSQVTDLSTVRRQQLSPQAAAFILPCPVGLSSLRQMCDKARYSANDGQPAIKRRTEQNRHKSRPTAR
jgi:hypothetical protein